MIIRSLSLGRGRIALPKSSSPIRSWRRYLADQRNNTGTSIERHPRQHTSEGRTLIAGRNQIEAQSSSEAQNSVEEEAFIENEPAGEQSLAGRPRVLQSLPPLPPRSVLKSEDIRDPLHPVVQAYLYEQHTRARTDHIGADVGQHYRPHEQLSRPPRPQDITLEQLLAAQTHLGHATSLWHPGNARYIHGVRGNPDGPEGAIHIISLDVTATHLRRACAVIRGVTLCGGLVLFVGTRQGQARSVVRAAQLAGGCHLFTRWTPGGISNAQQILGQCRKKVVDEQDQEVLGFQDQLQQRAALLPDLVVCLNPLENFVLLRECGQANIPTIGIIDTDANPTSVTYPIPANDDSLRSVQFIAGVLGRAGQEGQQERLALAKETNEAVPVSHGLRLPTKGQAEKELAEAERELRALNKLYEDAVPHVIPEETAVALERDAALAAPEEIDEAADEGAFDTLDPSLVQDIVLDPDPGRADVGNRVV